MRKLHLFVACAVLALGVSCSSNGTTDGTDGATASTNAIDVALQEYAFITTGEAKAGLLTINYSNTGEQLHMAIVGRLDAGKTLADVNAEVAKGDEGPPPPWFHDEPEDMSILSPGKQVSVTVDASDPGTYALLCFIPSPDGKPHVALGMTQTFEVTGTSDASAPAADGQIDLSEDRITVPGFTSGSRTVEVTNTGSGPGDINIVKLEQGKALEDIDKWFNKGEGPPPATFYGGTHGIEPGATKTMTFVLDPGTYTAVATFEQEKGPPKDVTVEFTIA